MDTEKSDIQYRFSAIDRLYGSGSLEKLQSKHIAIVGLGGVGSWVVESIARSGVGSLTLMDHDEFCLSNINRQMGATTSVTGKSKALVLAERCRDINPSIQVNVIQERFDSDSVETFFSASYDLVVDAIDTVRHKILLIAECYRRGIKVIAVGGSGGKRNPLDIKVRDLNITERDPLLFFVRKRLREEYNFPKRSELLGIPCVYSPETLWTANEWGQMEQGSKTRPAGPLDCATGLGTASYVTGGFGLTAAWAAVEGLLFDRWDYPVSE